MSSPFEGMATAERAALRKPSGEPLSGSVHGVGPGEPAIGPAGTAWQRQGELSAVCAGEPIFTDSELEGIKTAKTAAHAWIRGYQREGAEVFQRAGGPFSVVIVDHGGGEVLLATDRFALAPLCYSSDADTLNFASRADSPILRGGDLDPQAIFNYLYYHVIPSPATVFTEVHRLPAGHFLRRRRDGSISVQPYWKPRFHEPRNADFARLSREFRDLVEAAVRREAGQAQVGAFLSGGTDSSTVSGMLCRTRGEPAKTFSIGFDAEGYDEMDYARIAARHFRTDHHEYYVTPDDLLAAIPEVARHYDQPFGNSSAVPAYYCARLARSEGVEKMLAGDGGDELFGGNTRYAKQRIFSWYEFLPAGLRTQAIEPILIGTSGISRIPILRKAASYTEQARVPMPDRIGMYNLMTRLGAANLLTAEFLERVDSEVPLREQRAVYQAVTARSLINRMLAYDWKYTLADNDLPKVCGTTALADMQVGFPFLANEIVDFSLTLPPEFKLKGLKLRWFFKEALRGFLPDEILAKKKHGFGLPFGMWALRHQGLKRLAAESARALGARGIVRNDFIDRLLNELHPQHPGYYGEMIWILMMLEQWLQARAPDTNFG